MKIIKPSIEKLTLNENTILRQNGNYFQFIVLLTLLSPRIIVNFIRVTTAHYSNPLRGTRARSEAEIKLSLL